MRYYLLLVGAMEVNFDEKRKENANQIKKCFIVEQLTPGM